MDWYNCSRVSIHKTAAAYPEQPPFHPGERYPEYPFTETSQKANTVYAGVRDALRMLGLDAAHFGTPEWNPLGELVTPGDTVVLKPNVLREAHATRPVEWQQVITNGSVLRAIADYVFVALKGRGRIIIADAPQTDTDFAQVRRRLGLDEMEQFYASRDVKLEVLDLRRDLWFQKGDIIYKRVKLPGDPAGYTNVNLGPASEFTSYSLNGRFYGADYDTEEIRRFHQDGRHEYVLCRTVMDADVFINVPKLKSHKKVGATLSLKNLVGINGYRNCLPHQSMGTPDEGGDEFPTSQVHKLESRLTHGFKKLLTHLGGTGGGWARVVKKGGVLLFGKTEEVIRAGNWYGNQTAWRMVLDLNKALFYFNGAAAQRTKPLRYMTLIDGIIAGEGPGPAAPDAFPAGLLIAGLNPVAVDTVTCLLMGFDYQRIPLLQNAWRVNNYPLAGFGPADVACFSNVPEWAGTLDQLAAAQTYHFKPHFGWKGQIERQAVVEESLSAGR